MLEYVYDVAFDRYVTVIEDHSFDKTIDARFGTYLGMLSINLAPSGGLNGPDWPINLDFFQTRAKPSYAKLSSKVRVHKGYITEWERYRESFFAIIRGNEVLSRALMIGLVVSGRSKGGGEASIIALDLVRNFSIPPKNVFVGMLEAPKVGNEAYKESVEKYIPKNHLYWVRYGSDLVTMVPPLFKSPGDMIQIGKRTKLFSIMDHKRGCYNEAELVAFAEKWDYGRGDPI